MSLDESIREQLHHALLTNIKNDVIKTLNKKYYTEFVKIQLEAGTYWYQPLQENYNKLKEIKQQFHQDQYFFITICPYEDTTIEQLVKVMDKIMTKTWFKQFLYVYEQRQEEHGKPYYGIHAHILVARATKSKCEAIREIYNTAKNICGSKQSIDVKLLKTNEAVQIRIQYMLGEKSTEQKQRRQKIDKIFRQQHKLFSYYYSDKSWDDIIPTTLQSDLSKNISQ